MTTLKQARQLGKQYYLEGKPIEANPYQLAWTLAKEFRNGWLAQQAISMSEEI